MLAQMIAYCIDMNFKKLYVCEQMCVCGKISREPSTYSDEDMTKSKGKDPLEGLGGPMTRARARKAKEALQQVLSILFEYKPKFQGEKSKVVSCIMAQMEED